MNKELVKEHTIFKLRTGSHLYGTNIETSDEDFVGVFIPPVDYFLGLKNVDEVDLSTRVKDENNKNTSESIDFKVYNIKKFVKLALDNNPNILEMLFVNPDNIIENTIYGETLFASKHLFPHKGLIKKFLGYANSQKHKMLIRKDNFNELENNLKILKTLSPKDLMGEFKQHKDLNFNGAFFTIGDLNIAANVFVSKAIKMIENRLEKFSNRKTLISKYGYDTKFAMHLIRMLLESVELLRNHEIVYPLSNAELLLSIRNGDMNIKDILQLSDELEIKTFEAEKKSSLREKPEFNAINDLLIGIIEIYLQGDINE